MSESQSNNDKRREEELKKARLREQYMRLFFAPEARLRLANVKMVKPEIAEAIEDQVIKLGAAGKITRPITDEELKAMLGKFSEQRREFKIKYI